jgi:hypothetical protein
MPFYVVEWSTNDLTKWSLTELSVMVTKAYYWAKQFVVFLPYLHRTRVP